MKKMILLITFLCVFPNVVYAQRGCCSHHGGVAGCNSNGRQVCRDGTLSPSCTCTPTVTYIYGCTDKTAKNYNSKANKDNGSCVYYKYGCTDITAKNYDKKAEKNDGSCIYYKYGCTDENSINYDANAEKDDGTCISIVYGCMDKDAINYDAKANKDDNSCKYDISVINNTENIETLNNSSDSSIDTFIGTGVIGTVGYILYKIKKHKK